jgi:hypothetical protein
MEPHNLRRAMLAFTGEPDLVVVNSVQWTLARAQTEDPAWKTLFDDRARFESFAGGYLRNMSFVTQAVRAAFPASSVFVQTIPLTRDFSDRLLGGRTVGVVNQLARLVAAASPPGCVLDVSELALRHPGERLGSDGRHPSPAVTLAAVEMALAAARALRSGPPGTAP